MKNRLQEFRKEREMSQDDLGRILGVTRQTIGSIECGRYNPSIELAIRTARFFDCTVEEIFILEE